jgi:hypothetical protein
MSRVLLCLVLCALARPAGAFCGFFVAGNDAKLYNNASQVVLLRKGDRTVMTLSNNYKGPPEDFAMVVPVPVVLQKEDVKTLEPDVFAHIDSLSAPRLVEYWEQDPCYVPQPVRYRSGGGVRMPMKSAPARRPSDDELGVTVEAKFAVGEYQIVILSAKDSGGLETWLHLNNYKIPDGAAAALAPYVRDQMKFFVAKVDIQKVKRDEHQHVVLSPLRFGFSSNELRLPVRLGLLNAEPGQKQDLIVYILSPTSRFEVANYPNVFIPTNLEVADEVRQAFPSFYGQLFDGTLAARQGRAVVTEYAWQTTSCDPCPVPPLSAADLYHLGEDSLAGQAAQGQPGLPGPFFGRGPAWVLTRLHTRYDRTALSEDLLFREAKPVIGGRARGDGTNESSEAAPSSVNNFQARYIVRHYWTGPVTCQNPRYNRWGGPPGRRHSPPVAARGLAHAARGKVDLKRVVRSPVPLLGLAGHPRPARR